MAETDICILTSVHRALDGRIFEKEGRSLAEAGYSVTIVGEHERSEKLDGVDIAALTKPPGRRQRWLGLWKLAAAARRTKARVFHIHDPELLWPALYLRTTTGARIIYDVHENLPDQILTKPWLPKGMRPLVARTADLVERQAARRFDGVIAATSRVAERFPAEKTVVVRNYPIDPPASTANPTPYAQRRPLAAYVGGISEARGFREMIAAVNLLPAKLGARLIMAGVCSPAALEDDLRKTSCVEYFGLIPKSEVAGLLDQSRVGVVALHPTPNHLESLPCKLFEYMAAGLPVVASDFPVWREIVLKAECGLLVDPTQPAEIAGAIQFLLENPEKAEAMGGRGRAAITARYNWSSEVVKLLELYNRLLRD